MINTSTTHEYTVTSKRCGNGRPDGRSIGALLKELSSESSTLLRQEVELAKAEMGEKVARVGRNIAYLAIGGLVAFAGLLAVLAAASIGLALALDTVMDDTIAAWLGPLIVGAVVAIIGYALVQKAISTLKNESLKPEKTLEALREDTQWFKERMT